MLALVAACAGPSASPPDGEAHFDTVTGDTASGDSASPDTATECDTGEGRCRPEGVVDLSSAPDRVVGEVESGTFGLHAGGAGDVDGDGIADAWATAYVGEYAHELGLFLGPLTGERGATSADLRVSIDSRTRWDCGELHGGDDIDGDGVADLALVCREAALYLFSGALRGEVDPSVAFASLADEAGGDMPGFIPFAAVPAELDGDTSAMDLWIFGDEYNGESSYALWRIVSGPVEGELDEVSPTGEVRDVWPLGRLPRPRDLDGDGIDDILAAAQVLEPELVSGLVVFLGPHTGAREAADADLLAFAADEAACAGSAVIHDVDRDGHDDLVAGCHAADAPGGGAKMAGVAWVLSGSATGVVALEAGPASFAGSLPGQWLGAEVASADIDGDGALDLALAAPCPDGGCGGGEILVWYEPGPGVHEVDGADARFLLGVDGFPSVLDAAGDLDGDGIVDLLAGVGDWPGDGTELGALLPLWGGR